MSESVFNKSVLDKLFAFGEGAFDRVNEISAINAEAAKKLGATQAELAEALLALGGKQVELVGKAREPAELLRAALEYGASVRDAFETYADKLRGAADEAREGYSKLVLGAVEQAAA